MTDPNDLPAERQPIDDVPTITCARCNGEWDLSYELDELQVGNQAVEQFALDHKRHTRHFPDDVVPWIVTCTQCPDGEEYLSDRPSKRWARTHARHTGHRVMVHHQSLDESLTIEPSDTHS